MNNTKSGLLTNTTGPTVTNGLETTRLAASNTVTNTTTAAQSATESVPSKYVSITERVLFTCSFQSYYQAPYHLSGHMDFKAFRTLYQKLAPQRLLLVRGTDEECQGVLRYLQHQQQQQQSQQQQSTNSNNNTAGSGSGSILLDCVAPINRKAFVFHVRTEKLTLLIPRALVPSNLQIVRMSHLLLEGSTMTVGVGGNSSSSVGGSGSSNSGVSGTGSSSNEEGQHSSSIGLLQGEIMISDQVSQQYLQAHLEGTRIMRYLGKSTAIKAAAAAAAEKLRLAVLNQDDTNTVDKASEEQQQQPPQKRSRKMKTREEDDEIVTTEEENEADEADLPIEETNLLGVVSHGEVTLTMLKTLFELKNIKTNIGMNGNSLICNDQVIIRKDNNNNFQVEGPPIKAFYDARKILYEQFAFL
jgi:hypothetical protein